ncbi:MAG: hypothetical protein WCG10_07820, partial [Chlamydiota bacterium]
SFKADEITKDVNRTTTISACLPQAGELDHKLSVEKDKIKTDSSSFDMFEEEGGFISPVPSSRNESSWSTPLEFFRRPVNSFKADEITKDVNRTTTISPCLPQAGELDHKLSVEKAEIKTDSRSNEDGPKLIGSWFEWFLSGGKSIKKFIGENLESLGRSDAQFKYNSLVDNLKNDKKVCEASLNSYIESYAQGKSYSSNDQPINLDDIPVVHQDFEREGFVTSVSAVKDYKGLEIDTWPHWFKKAEMTFTDLVIRFADAMQQAYAQSDELKRDAVKNQTQTCDISLSYYIEHILPIRERSDVVQPYFQEDVPVIESEAYQSIFQQVDDFLKAKANKANLQVAELEIKKAAQDITHQICALSASVGLDQAAIEKITLSVFELEKVTALNVDSTKQLAPARSLDMVEGVGAQEDLLLEVVQGGSWLREFFGKVVQEVKGVVAVDIGKSAKKFEIIPYPQPQTLILKDQATPKSFITSTALMPITQKVCLVEASTNEKKEQFLIGLLRSGERSFKKIWPVGEYKQSQNLVSSQSSTVVAKNDSSDQFDMFEGIDPKEDQLLRVYSQYKNFLTNPTKIESQSIHAVTNVTVDSTKQLAPARSLDMVEGVGAQEDLLLEVVQGGSWLREFFGKVVQEVKGVVAVDIGKSAKKFEIIPYPQPQTLILKDQATPKSFITSTALMPITQKVCLVEASTNKKKEQFFIGLLRSGERSFKKIWPVGQYKQSQELVSLQSSTVVSKNDSSDRLD